MLENLPPHYNSYPKSNKFLICCCDKFHDESLKFQLFKGEQHEERVFSQRNFIDPLRV